VGAQYWPRTRSALGSRRLSYSLASGSVVGSSLRKALPTVAILAVAVLAAAWPATAAKPHKGARYVGFEGSERA